MREVRLIGPDGKQIGIVSSQEALKKAKGYGLDLVEISSSARPPVCRILDFGKYRYEQSKKQKDKKDTSSKIKEVKFRVRIEQHDYITKLRRAEQFLAKGNMVKLTLQFRGREMEHVELGRQVIERAVKDLENIGHTENEPRLNGRFLNLVMAPLPPNKRKLVFNTTIDEDDDSGEEEDDPDDDDDDLGHESAGNSGTAEEPVSAPPGETEPRRG